MTATNLVLQPHNRAILALCDGAYYSVDGVLRGIGTKVRTVPHWPGLVTGRGGSIPLAVLTAHLLHKFASFDALVAGVESELPALVEQYGFDEWCAEARPELIFAGWSAERDRPESYVINVSDELSPGDDQLVFEPGAIVPRRYRLQELPACVAGPLVPRDHPLMRDFDGVRISESIEIAIADLMTLIEIQRHYRPEGVDHCFVGGFAELTFIRPDAIEQRVMRRWKTDRIGERITPEPWRPMRRARKDFAAGQGGPSRVFQHSGRPVLF